MATHRRVASARPEAGVGPVLAVLARRVDRPDEMLEVGSNATYRCDCAMIPRAQEAGGGHIGAYLNYAAEIIAVRDTKVWALCSNFGFPLGTSKSLGLDGADQVPVAVRPRTPMKGDRKCFLLRGSSRFIAVPAMRKVDRVYRECAAATDNAGCRDKPTEPSGCDRQG
jgi:hypothetical protein